LAAMIRIPGAVLFAGSTACGSEAGLSMHKYRFLGGLKRVLEKDLGRFPRSSCQGGGLHAPVLPRTPWTGVKCGNRFGS
jgi:hypothetical protein